MAHIGPFLFLGARCLIAATALAPFAFIEQKRIRLGFYRAKAWLHTVAGHLFILFRYLAPERRQPDKLHAG